MRRPFLSLVAAAAVAGVTLTGCGGSGASTTASKTPKAAFTSGLSGLGDSDALTVTLKLDTTPEKLMSFAREGGDRVDAATAQKIATAQVVIETKTSDGSKLSALKPGTKTGVGFRLALVDGGQTYAQLLKAGNGLYVQAQAQQLLDLVGKASTFDTLRSRAAQMPPFVRAFVAGRWVVLDLGQLKAMASQFGANVSPTQQQTQKLMADLKAAVSKDVSVTRVGADDQGDHLRLTAQSRQLVTDVLGAVTGAIPAAGLATSSLKPESIPARPVTVDSWVKDGSLSKLSIDLVQFAKPGEAKPGDSLPLVLTFDHSGDDISAPTGAERVDMSQLFTMLGALGGKTG